jgi:hypothetical protein
MGWFARLPLLLYIVVVLAQAGHAGRPQVRVSPPASGAKARGTRSAASNCQQSCAPCPPPPRSQGRALRKWAAASAPQARGQVGGAMRLQRRPLGRHHARRRAQHTPRPNTRCPLSCLKHGVCNEELGRCDCPRNFEGPSCATEVLDLTRACTAYGYTKDR